MSGEGLYPGIGIGLILGLAVACVLLSLFVAAKEADRISDDEHVQALRDKGIL